MDETFFRFLNFNNDIEGDFELRMNQLIMKNHFQQFKIRVIFLSV